MLHAHILHFFVLCYMKCMLLHALILNVRVWSYIICVNKMSRKTRLQYSSTVLELGILVYVCVCKYLSMNVCTLLYVNPVLGAILEKFPILNEDRNSLR